MKPMFRIPALVAALALAATGCRVVDENEHCITTSYGEVIEQRASSGLNSEFFRDYTCFTLAQQNFPGGVDDAGKPIPEVIVTPVEKIAVSSDVAVVWGYAPGQVFDVFREKRTPHAAEMEVHNAIREGFRVAISGWTLDRLLSPDRERLGDQAKEVIQRKLGDRYVVHDVYVRDIALPATIQKAQLDAIQAVRDQQTAMAQFKRDSVTLAKQAYEAEVNARIQLESARADAEAKRLLAASYGSNPSLLQLEVERARAEGMKGICNGTQNCYLGEQVLSRLLGSGSGERR